MKKDIDENIEMGNNHVKKSKSTNPEYATPKPPEGMPNPMDFDLQDIETPDDVFIQRQTRGNYLHVPSILEPVDEISDTTSCMTKSINISSSDSRSKRSFNVSAGSGSLDIDADHPGGTNSRLRFYPGDTLSVQTSTSNETKSSSHSSEGGKRYKNKHNFDASLEEQSFESEEQNAIGGQLAKQFDNGRRIMIDLENKDESCKYPEDNNANAPCINIIQVAEQSPSKSQEKSGKSAYFLARAKAKSHHTCRDDQEMANNKEGICVANSSYSSNFLEVPGEKKISSHAKNYFIDSIQNRRRNFSKHRNLVVMATGNRTLLKSNNNSESTGLSQENCYNADQSIKEEEKIEGNINELPDFKMLGRLKVRSKQKKGSIDCLKAFNSLDEINSDEKGYAKNADYSFKGTKAANIDIYNVSNDFSKSHVDGGMNSSEGYLFSPKQSHANRLPSLQSTDMIRKGPSLNRIEVYNTNRNEINRGSNIQRFTWSSNINESIDGTQNFKDCDKETSKALEIKQSTNTLITNQYFQSSQKQDSKNVIIGTVDASQVIPVVDIV